MKMKICQILAPRKGNALVLVVLLFMFISILVMAALLTAQVQINIVIAQEKVDQAYYTSRAVVEASSQWIQKKYNARDKMALVIPPRTTLGETYAYSTISDLDGIPYTLKLWRDNTNEDKIYIEAAATYGGYTQTTKLSLDETISGFDLFEDAIYSEGPFGKSSGNSNIVNGSVATGSSSIPSNLNVNGTKTTDKHYDFDKVLPPANAVFPAIIASETLNNNGVINGNANYGTLHIDGNIFIENTNPAVDVHIKVDNLYITSSAIVNPTNYDGGRIFIYVNSYIWCDKKFGITGNDAHPVVYIICNGIGNINFSGNPSMNVFLYGPDVDVEYGGTTVFNGAIIANVYGWNGNISVSYRQPDLEDSPFSALNDAQKRINIYNVTWLKE